jgi:glyoxylase-like metal-dependent hydrolase (beta-lactamase superfamily II)
MAALLNVLTAGYVGDRVASTVVLVRDGDVTAIVDPGMVASRDRILAPLRELAVAPEDVTDVVFSHHHPDHTLNAALFPRARYHDFWAVYQDDLWTTRLLANEPDGWALSPSVRLLHTPGHSAEDLSTIVDTDDGLVVCTHAWWTRQGPASDPYAPSEAVLTASRTRLLDLAPALIVPGHGAAFAPDQSTPR